MLGGRPQESSISDLLPMMRTDTQSNQGSCPVDKPFAERLVGTNTDVRTVLHFKLHDDAVQGMLPPGWEVDSPSSGYAAGANLRATFIDTVAAHDPSGSPRPGVCYMHIGILAKRQDFGRRGLMLFTGLSPSGAGPYRTNLAATAHVERKVLHQPNHSTTEESWRFDGATASVSLRLAFARGGIAREEGSLNVYSRAVPEFFRIYRYTQCLDVIQGGAVDGQRLHQFEFKAAGQPFAHFFDGSEQLISVVSIPSYSRQVFLPEPL